MFLILSLIPVKHRELPGIRMFMMKEIHYAYGVLQEEGIYLCKDNRPSVCDVRA
jgi:hypothetical protein